MGKQSYSSFLLKSKVLSKYSLLKKEKCESDSKTQPVIKILLKCLLGGQGGGEDLRGLGGRGKNRIKTYCMKTCKN